MDNKPKAPSRLPLIVGLVLMAAGWAVLYVGWWRASRLDIETGQIPYVLSGGFGGVGLLLLGASAIVVDAIQRMGHSAHRSVEEMVDVVRALADELRPAPEPVLEESEEEETPADRRRRRRRRAG